MYVNHFDDNRASSSQSSKMRRNFERHPQSSPSPVSLMRIKSPFMTYVESAERRAKLFNMSSECTLSSYRSSENLNFSSSLRESRLNAHTLQCSKLSKKLGGSHGTRPSINPPLFSPCAIPKKVFERTLPRHLTDSKSEFIIPPACAADEGKLVVVLDLDETLVFSRAGPVEVRPGLRRLLEVLEGRCEVVVWTAGERQYAADVIRLIDPNCCIKNCVFRHRNWWSEGGGNVKNIAALGRPLHRTIIIDNTPECLRANPLNGILVMDYRGKKDPLSRADNTLFVIAEVMDRILKSPFVSVALLHHQPQLCLRRVMCVGGSTLDVFTLRQDQYYENMRPPVFSEICRSTIR